MISSENEHGRIRILFCKFQGGGSHGSCRVSAEWLEQKRGQHTRGIDLAKLVFGLEEKLPVGDGQYFIDARQLDTAQKGLLQQALTIREPDEGLGVGFTGNRPEPGTGSAAEDYGNEGHGDS